MSQSGPSLAILDDEPELRKALQRLLTGCGFHVQPHATAEAFLQSLETTVPDCLLLDLHMAGTDGYAVLGSLQERGHSFPVIVITALDEPAAEQRVRGLGARAFLRKPVDQETLLTAISDCLPFVPDLPRFPV